MKKFMTGAIAAGVMTAAFTMGAFAAANTVDVDGVKFDIPEQYVDLLTVETEGLEDGELVSVSETASIEAAKAQGDETSGAGWLFSISKISEDKLHDLRCNYLEGMTVFAEDDDTYYVLNHPTDVRLIRESNDEMDAAMDQWGDLNAWAREDVVSQILANNTELDPESFSNTQLDRFLSVAAYDPEANYEIKSLVLGTLDPVTAGNREGAKELAEDAVYADVTDTVEDELDGEYYVLNFPDEQLRYEFLQSDGLKNYIREVQYDSGEDIVTAVYEASFKEDMDETATDVIEEWCHELTGTETEDED